MGVVVDTAAQGIDTKGVYRAAEWQPEATFATGPMSENTDGHAPHRFITRPRCATSYGNAYGGTYTTYEVAEIGHAQLNVGGFVVSQKANTLAVLQAEIDEARDSAHAELGVVLGVVFHAREYAATPRDVEGDEYPTDQAYLDAIFKLFADKGVKVVTAREILSAAAPCSP